MSTLKLDTIASRDGTESTDVTNVINGSAKAWVNFDGTGTVAIRESFNVASITDLATGRYEINFTNAFEDINYVCLGTTNLNTTGGGSSNYNRAINANAGTVSKAYFNTYTVSGTALIDIQVNQAAFFR